VCVTPAADGVQVNHSSSYFARTHTHTHTHTEQDTFIWHNHLQRLGNNGTYVDVGAYHPYQLSNTAFLDICLGWRGLCIEMNPDRRALFEQVPEKQKLLALSPNICWFLTLVPSLSALDSLVSRLSNYETHAC
jgi:hypothetical protein